MLTHTPRLVASAITSGAPSSSGAMVITRMWPRAACQSLSKVPRVGRPICTKDHRTNSSRTGCWLKKKDPTPQLLLAQEQEIQQLVVRFQAADPTGVEVQQLEMLVRMAIFKPANALIGFLLQAAADRVDASYQPKPGQHYKGRQSYEKRRAPTTERNCDNTPCVRCGGRS